jgi:hypothetical protein
MPAHNTPTLVALAAGVHADLELEIADGKIDKDDAERVLIDRLKKARPELSLSVIKALISLVHVATTKLGVTPEDLGADDESETEPDLTGDDEGVA